MSLPPPSFTWIDRSGPRIALRHRPAERPRRGPPVLFVHGATLASEIYDVPVRGHSWMAHAAAHGGDAFAVDVLGFGRSDRSPSFERPQGEGEPYASHKAAFDDIAGAVERSLTRTNADRLDLVGGSWGSITAAIDATRLAHSLRRLVLFAPIFAEVNQCFAMTADPADRSRVNSNLGANRRVTRDDVRGRWDAEIPGADKTAFRPESVFAALMDEALSNDPRASDHDPPAMRVPCGPLVDLHAAFSGQALYDPAHIVAPTLLLRGDCDPTSTASDMERLAGALCDAREVTIANASHFAVAEHAASDVFAAAESFLSENP